MENFALYYLHEMQRFWVSPLRAFANANRRVHSNPMSPLSHTSFGKSLLASSELVERLTRNYTKPEFGITETEINGKKVAVRDKVVHTRSFCQLRYFERDIKRPNDPIILLVAPMSGHYATLLRGTVKGLLPHAHVYITDWTDAKEIPLYQGGFDLNDYISYLIDFVQFIKRTWLNLMLAIKRSKAKYMSSF